MIFQISAFNKLNFDQINNPDDFASGFLIFIALYTTNFTEPLSYQDSAFLKLPKFP
jgi:hypothetical protein